jgi:hypothetical protein
MLWRSLSNIDVNYDCQTPIRSKLQPKGGMFKPRVYSGFGRQDETEDDDDVDGGSFHRSMDHHTT